MTNFKNAFATRSKRSLELSAYLLLTAVVSSSTMSPANAEPTLTMPGKLPTQKRAAVKTPESVTDQLLVMASPKADSDDFNESMEAVHGKVIDTIGEGAMKVYVVQTEKGKGDETEKKLTKDANISMVQKNFKLQLQQAAPPPANDPVFPSQWHIGAMRAPAAWAQSRAGQGSVIAVLDSGVPPQGVDLAGKVFAGYDSVRRANGQTPFGTHGALVASVAGAVTNNKINGAAVAPNALIYPFKICDADGFISEAALLHSMVIAGNNKFRIMNISVNGVAPFTLSNKNVHPVFHAYADTYHNKQNGMIFLSAGNGGDQDPSPISPNIMVVSAINQNLTRAGFSDFGPSVWFTAPGVNIVATTTAGRVATVSGTSFAAPCVSAVAAMVLSTNPNMTNRQIEQILIRTARKVGGATGYTQAYGYGLPDATAAVKSARSAIFF